ncbi:sterol desaturase family protein [Mycolicibacterium litorale]|uniref:Fatty acid hydroxylase n=1 Tax=Mycolicibacterium litorale TaxID=758802 RepID=A0AAD1IJE2_9MYCO|nr:sterol desaturase family protein [Mycolicibacterium litorale]MCV7414842.1 sterol desaturase family protein [Mycolicibacterium litorale]TDY08089.1 fatty acid hydroxylase family protein [Mycolicibacterium litorale]BBY16011.1 fatty acid hydroxylase [Mycolicibacterium litorale]
MTRRTFTLADAGREFWRHPSPWLIAGTLVVAVCARVAVGDWQGTDAVVPVAMLAAFPFVEWVVHVCVLHWRPRRLGRLRIDPLLARKHREHHVDPRDIPLIFIPWQALLWVLPVALGVALLAFPRLGMGLTFLVCLTILGVAYEWCHYLIHSDYKPKTAAYRAVWRNHRQHHFKNEHYWFTVTSAGTADRVLGTYPDPAGVATSPTAKNLHGVTTGR